MSESKELILSDSRLKSESKKIALMSNSSLIPTVVGVCGTPILFVAEQILAMYASIGLISLGFLMMIVNTTLRKDTFKNVYLSRHNKKLEKHLRKKREELRKSLRNESAKNQVEAFEKKYEHFKKSLEKELSQESYSYQRLLGAFDQVFQLGLEKVEKILNYEKNQDKIDLQRILKEMHPLRQKEKKGVLSENDKVKLQSLEDSLKIRESYEAKIEENLTQNEQALAKMNVLQATLTDLHKPQNMKIAMQELSDLAVALDFEEKNAMKFD